MIKFLLTTLLVAISLVAATGVRATPNEPIRIGVLTSLSDEWAAVGQNIVRGAELARDEINKNGGIRGRLIELVVEDTHEANSGAKAVSAYRSLRQRNIAFYIGPTGAPAGMSLAPIVRSDRVVMITPMVGVRDFSDSGTNIFNARGVDDAASRSTAAFALQRGWKTAAVLSSQQPWESAQGRAFRDAFINGRGSIVGFEEPLPDMQDLRGPITKIISHKPQVIFLSNSNRLPVAGKQLAEAGYKGPKLAALLDDSMVKAANGTLEGTRFASFGGAGKTFTDKFLATFNEKPSLGADTGYDAVKALAAAMTDSGTNDPALVASKLLGVHIDGSAGDFSFDRDRIARRQLSQFEVRKGVITPVS